MINIPFRLFHDKAIKKKLRKGWKYRIIFWSILFYICAIPISAQGAGDTTFSLSFPLQDYNPYSVPIGCVFDHSMNTPLDKDGMVIAYTGEIGNYRKSFIEHCDGCYSNFYSQKFMVNGNYAGLSICGGSNYLCYDGHPGFDYPLPKDTPVYAAASGVVSKPNIYHDLTDAQKYNIIEIDHQNGYKTYYIHLSTQLVSEGEIVSRGQLIGLTGNTGSPGFYHLHFEVQFNGIPVDPYGWDGDNIDPYKPATNVNLWAH